ncbi:hypothetical protein ABTW72_30030 [Micromonospora sp. NPDC127501]|uniref:hypothetical protein n=1 Tax=Micromonospora sp. NPDC127501 TaxID=3154872 RepID=UPI0033309CBE
MTARRTAGNGSPRAGRLFTAALVGLVIAAILVISAARDQFGSGIAVAVAVITVWLLATFLPLRRR